MTTQHEQVTEFMRAFGQATPSSPAIPDEATVRLRYELIKEELHELRKAMQERDLVEIADALADILYVTHGAMVAFGINGDAVFAEVHRSNMAKLWTKEDVASKDDSFWMEPNGIHRKHGMIASGEKFLVVRGDGKVVKPPSWKKPDIKGAMGAKPEPCDAAKELDLIKSLLQDKASVRANILRGTIAIPDDLAWLHDTHGPVAALRNEDERLREAIRITLEENAHLADGENCTLIRLKKALTPSP